MNQWLAIIITMIIGIGMVWVNNLWEDKRKYQDLYEQLLYKKNKDKWHEEDRDHLCDYRIIGGHW